MSGPPTGDRSALITLAHVLEPGDERWGELVASWGAQQVLDRIERGLTGHVHEEGVRARLAQVRSRTGDRWDPEDEAARLGARIITSLDREWPSQLSALGRTTPLALWLLGAADLRLLALRSVAIVGARACTAYGEEVSRTWAADLAGDAWTVVSGAAFGIDAAAHRGALSAGGTTIAVLAGGIDVPYPRAHAPLIDAIADSGVVVSESPPGEQVRRHRFLSRNRLIAALGRATVVVEAAVRSGAAATAADARSLARPVLAVPGPVTSPASFGCHRMIQEGDALLASHVDDVRQALDLTARSASSSAVQDRRTGRDALPSREREVLDAMPARRSMSLDALVVAAGRSPGEVLAAAGVLVAEGWLALEADGWRLIRR